LTKLIHFFAQENKENNKALEEWRLNF